MTENLKRVSGGEGPVIAPVDPGALLGAPGDDQEGGLAALIQAARRALAALALDRYGANP